MASMKKHPLIQVDFDCTVKLRPKELKRLLTWLEVASQVFGDFLREKGLIHSSWLLKNQSFRVSILLCGQTRIRRLNKEFRHKDKATDVLSFPSIETLRQKNSQLPLASGEIFLGDLAICHQKTLSQARQFQIGYLDEFIHLYAHGWLHLLGYDHEISEKEEKLMQDWEQQLLERFSKLRKKKGAL
jgi:probable rRNA maturation factor